MVKRLRRRPLTAKSAVRVRLEVPSVMVYKSFLIDHHFCIFRGIFAFFEQFHSESSDRVADNPLPSLFLCLKKA